MLSVLNVLMQLRKVCNHPNLFETRPVESSFVTRQLRVHVPAVVLNARRHIDRGSLPDIHAASTDGGDEDDIEAVVDRVLPVDPMAKHVNVDVANFSTDLPDVNWVRRRCDPADNCRVRAVKPARSVVVDGAVAKKTTTSTVNTTSVSSAEAPVESRAPDLVLPVSSE